MAKSDQKSPDRKGEDKFFAQFQLKDQPEYKGPDPKDTKGDADKTADTTDARVEALTAQLSAVTQQMQHMQQTQMLANMGQTQAPQPPQAPQLDLSGLPDPLDDQKGYQDGISKRVADHNAAFMDYTEQKQAYDRNQESRGERLWANFNRKHEEFAENQALVEFASTQVVNEAIAKGLDVNKYVFGTEDLFFSDVIAKMKEVAPGIAAQSGDEGAEASGDTKDDSTDDAIRTGGLPGGHESGGRGSADPDTKTEKGDMIEELHEIQRKEGFF